MLEVAFIELVSAGLRRFFITGGTPGAATAASDGGALVRHLLITNPEPAGALVNRCVTDLWRQIQANGLEPDVAAAHLELLPAILADDETAPDGGAAFFNQSPTALADAIVLAHDIDTSARGIDEIVLTFLLETFLKSLNASRPEIEALGPMLAAAAPPPVDPAADPEPAPAETAPLAAAQPEAAPQETAPARSTRARSQATLTLEKIARADALGVSVPLLELITVALINRTRSPHLREADLTAAAGEARALRGALADLAARRPVDRPDLDTLLTTFDSGRFEALNHTLTAIEEVAVHRATSRSPRIPEHVECAIEMRILRARLHALQGADVAAARQLGNAQRHVARTDHARRWQLARQEVRHYERAAFHARQPAHLESAARTCSAVLANLAHDTAPALRAEIHSELAHYLILLGQHEQSASRFEIAAQLLADAIAHLTAGDPPALRLLTLVRQGDALMALARLAGATQLPDQAIASYEQATDLLPAVARQPAPAALRRPFDESVLALRTRLALALVSRLDHHAELSLHHAAIETIVDVLPDLTAPHDLADDAGFPASLLAGMCHHVIAGWLAATADAASARRHIATANDILEDTGFQRLAETLTRETEDRLRDKLLEIAAAAQDDTAHSATAA